MKQKDLALIIVIAAISATISFTASHFLFASSGDQQQKAPLVAPITTSFVQPDAKFFNSQSFDPAKLITVGSGNNSNPFNGTGQ